MTSDLGHRQPGQRANDTVRQCISMLESMDVSTSPTVTSQSPAFMELPGGRASWQNTSNPPIYRQLQNRCFDDEDGGYALGSGPGPSERHHSFNGSFSTSSGSLDDVDVMTSALSSAPPSPPPSEANEQPQQFETSCLLPYTPSGGATLLSDAVGPAPVGLLSEHRRAVAATSCIELMEWTGEPGDVGTGTEVEGGIKVDAAELQALRFENQRLLADLKRTQALLMKKKSENANMKCIVKELTEKRATDVAQRHHAQEAMANMQYDNMRLQRAHDIARQHVQQQQQRLAAKEAELGECTKRMVYAECALVAAQRSTRTLRSQNAVLEKRLSFLERMQLVESRMESVCARSYTQTVELY